MSESTLTPFRGLYEVRRGHFLAKSGKFSLGTKYGPLLTDHFAFLCPDCGGWGEIGSRLAEASERSVCKYCNGEGEIALDDKRVVDFDPR